MRSNPRFSSGVHFLSYFAPYVDCNNSDVNNVKAVHQLRLTTGTVSLNDLTPEIRKVSAHAHCVYAPVVMTRKFLHSDNCKIRPTRRDEKQKHLTFSLLSRYPQRFAWRKRRPPSGFSDARRRSFRELGQPVGQKFRRRYEIPRTRQRPERPADRK